ncbi:DUF6898 family protein [Novispirillum sp. DQ9]|uniref:DUF6898 family protein n=1 Tax=Novispirillum sp. DQ9 TaxID=3398612 RepID=UPI003C7AC3BB
MGQRNNIRDNDLGEVLVELHTIGASTRVSAIHVATNTEVQVVCPTSYTRFSMTQAALRKLRYVLGKAGAGPAK